MMRAALRMSQSAIDRPVALRMRADLIVRSRMVGPQLRMVIKDPITLAHHQLWEEEFALLEMLDGRTSYADMRQAFESRFRPARLDYARLETLHGVFHRNGLVLSENAGQAEQLMARKARAKQRVGWRIQELLAIRMRGVNPDRILSALDRRLGWCLSPPWLLATALFILGTFLVLVVRWPSVVPRLPELDAYLTPANIIWLTVAFGGLKVIHELGHGLACKHFGGECNEIGLMWLVAAPCLYCDISDSWMIDNRWKRAFVAAAGMWFEMIVASMCVWLWWVSHPGLLHTIFFNTMLVGGLGTLAFNANPLLRYDGYFVVSDMLDAPNLWRQSRIALGNTLECFFFHRSKRVVAGSPEPVPAILGLYALASVVYQFVFTLVILGVVYKILQLLRLEIVGVALVSVLAMSIFFPMITKTAQFLTNRRLLSRLRRRRAALGIFLMSMAIWAVMLLPVPSTITVPVWIQLADARPVTVTIAGRMIARVSEGQSVVLGQELARLESPETDLELITRQGELSRQQTRLVGLESRRGLDPLVVRQIASAREAIDGLDAEIHRLSSAAERLVLRAPCDGIVVSPGERTSPNDTGRPDLGGAALATQEFWSGTPLDRANQGCFLKTGDELCVIASQAAVRGLVFLTQSQVELIEIGQAVVVRSAQFPRQTLYGQVVEVASINDPKLPREIGRAGVLPSHAQSDGLNATLEPIYVCRLNLDLPKFKAVNETMGRARIRLRNRSLGERLWRLINETFSFQSTV